MQEMVYLYDGSFEGFLCCVFESYTRKEVLTAIYSDEDFSLFTTRMVTTDPAHARRVYRSLVKISPQAADVIRRGFLTCMPEREMHLYRLIRRLYKEGAPLLRRFSDPDCYPVFTAIRHLNGEAHLLKGFVRFSEFSGVLGAEIEPKNHVLPLLRGHFCGRYQNECFFIYDKTHKETLFYADGKAQILPVDHFQMAPPDETEASFRLLWKRFYDTIAIRERENPVCRRTHMPKRYWGTMTEFQPPSYFKAQTSAEDALLPSAQDGIPAPETLPGSGPSAVG